MSVEGLVTADEIRRVRAAAAGRREAAIAFARDLVRIPSPSGDEGAAARRTLSELQALGLDEAALDRAGNVVGVLRANVPDPLPGAVLLDAHLDHVDEGDASRWPHPPFEGVIAGDRLHGRGSTDTKSAVAGMAHAAGLLAALDVPRHRDVVVAAVVQEEVGGLGTACLLESGPPVAAAIIGEPSEGALAHGHRGRVELEVAFLGRAAHASRPEWGQNPHPALARFVTALSDVPRDTDPRFGRSTVSPTLVRVEPRSPNVIPAEVALTLDWRNVPGESPDAVAERVRDLARRAAGGDVRVEVRTPVRELVSWTGLRREVPRVSLGFAVSPDEPWLDRCRSLLARALDRPVRVMPWDFSSDGGWLAARGVPCVGHGPGDMAVMHAVTESVSLDLLAESVATYALLAISLGREALGAEAA